MAHGHGAQPAPGRVAAAPVRSGWWPVRVARWTAERHGLVVLAPVLLLFALSFSAGALLLEEDMLLGRPVNGFAMTIGGAAFWSWYLMLRALDDLQDAAADAVAHPERMLARGAISRRDLWLLVGAALVVQGVASWWIEADELSNTVSFIWLAMLGVLLFAAIDFALPTFFTDDHPAVLPILRSPASILPVVWVYAMGATGITALNASIFTTTTLALAAIALFTLANVEVARRRPDGAEPSARIPGVLVGLLTALCTACMGLLALEDVTLPTFGVVVLIVAGAFAQARTKRVVVSTQVYVNGLLLMTTVCLAGAAW